jgi:excisionase family DNA binding protein
MQTASDSPEFVTVQQAAVQLQVHVDTIRRWLRAGQIQGTLLGGSKAGYRISSSEIQRVLRDGVGQTRQGNR